MTREILKEDELPPFIAFCESRGWRQIPSVGSDVLTMVKKGKHTMHVGGACPKPGVLVLYNEAARMCAEWREGGK